MNFKDKVFLITGSTSGIGQGIAKALLEQGAKIVINYAHNEENAEETRKIFKQYQDKTLFIKADISDEKSVIEMYKKIEEKFDKLDGLVNNAVYDKIFKIEDLSVEEFRKELDVNVIARAMCIKYAIPLLKKSNMPRIVNIASRLGTKPMEGSVAYCTSEAATIMLTKMCALELTKKYNIKTNTVSPSMTLTPFAKKSYTEEEIKQTAMKNPSGRLGEVEDTVNAVLFLLSEKADYINGENLNVNGGILLI
ncbi:MAG: SDR family oxidoreductase [Clostridia bacterium]|nr:SDR family oxidoreductase [Clostridia bacterium]